MIDSPCIRGARAPLAVLTARLLQAPPVALVQRKIVCPDTGLLHQNEFLFMLFTPARASGKVVADPRADEQRKGKPEKEFTMVLAALQSLFDSPLVCSGVSGSIGIAIGSAVTYWLQWHNRRAQRWNAIAEPVRRRLSDARNRYLSAGELISAAELDALCQFSGLWRRRSLRRAAEQLRACHEQQSALDPSPGWYAPIYRDQAAVDAAVARLLHEIALR